MIQLNPKTVIGTVTSLQAGEVVVLATTSSLAVGNAVNESKEVSDVHIGEFQPLGNKKIWIDTNEMVVKYNTGAAWEAKPTDVAPVDYGGFNPQAVNGWIDITDSSFWDLTNSNTVNTTTWDGSKYTTVVEEVWLYVKGAPIAGTLEELTLATYWSKGLRPTHFRATFLGATQNMVITAVDDVNLLIEVSYPISGQAYPITWPDDSYLRDIGSIDLYGIGPSEVTKIELFYP